MAGIKSVMAPVKYDPETGEVVSGGKEFHVQAWMVDLIRVTLLGVENEDGTRKELEFLKDRLAAAGVTYGKWNTWCRKPGFVDWFNNMMVQYGVEPYIGQVHMMTAKRAMEGRNPAFTKLFYERFDKKYVPQQKTIVQEKPAPLVITMGGVEEKGLLSKLAHTEDGNVMIEAGPAAKTLEEIEEDKVP